MVWICKNGHEVRDGMFVCGVCGSGEGAEDGTPSAPTLSKRAQLRVEARRELSSRLSTGIVLIVAGLLCLALFAGAVADGDAGPIAVILQAAAYLLYVVGAAFVLVAIIGHGVRLGIESARTRRPD